MQTLFLLIQMVMANPTTMKLADSLERVPVKPLPFTTPEVKPIGLKEKKALTTSGTMV